MGNWTSSCINNPSHELMRVHYSELDKVPITFGLNWRRQPFLTGYPLPQRWEPSSHHNGRRKVLRKSVEILHGPARKLCHVSSWFLRPTCQGGPPWERERVRDLRSARQAMSSLRVACQMHSAKGKPRLLVLLQKVSGSKSFPRLKSALAKQAGLTALLI